MRLRTLLVPLDGTLFSQAILPAIKHLLRMEDYTIVLLRVGAPVHGVIGVPPRPASMAVPIPTFERAEDLTYSRHPISASQQELNARAELLDSLAPARRLWPAPKNSRWT
ncbi:MAG: hypothetical protein MUD01_20800 [Chloroflexaceae bacterium]|nr:hypothetical protein [Chloroflexaceae bacterium]